MLRIKLVKSPIGNTANNRKIVAALGLRKMHHVVEHQDNPSIRGMIHKVKHMLAVEEVADQPVQPVETKSKAKKPKAETQPEAAPVVEEPASEEPAEVKE